MRVVKWMAGMLTVVLLVAAGVAWWQREPLQSWWIVRGLCQSDEAGQAVWVERLDWLGEVAVTPLVDRLADADESARANLLAGLDYLASRNRPGIVCQEIAKPYAKFSTPTRAEVLAHLREWHQPDADPAPWLKILQQASTDPDPAIQLPALELAASLLTQPGKDVLAVVRETTRAGLASPSAEIRLKAIQLSLQPGVEMLEPVVALLRDPSVEVRRAALLCVGPAEQIAREDLLLAGLHDEDEEIRKLTEAALRGRGLRPEHLELGRLLTHPKPTERLQVIDRIRDVLEEGQGDLDPGAWLRRLSHDQSPAVRVAALRLMNQQTMIDLSDRVAQMARSDPSPTVAQLARFYQNSKR